MIPPLVASWLYKFNPTEFNWTADVWVPVMLALTLGVFLSIYTGIISSRLVLFTQLREQAALAVSQAWMGMATASTSQEMLFHLGGAINPARFSLRNMGHLGAADRIANCFFKAHMLALECSGYDMTSISPRDRQLGVLPALPTLTPVQFRIFKQRFTDRYLAEMESDAEYLLGSSRNILAIFLTQGAARWWARRISRRVQLAPNHGSSPGQ